MNDAPNYLENKYTVTEIREEKINAFETNDEFNQLGVELFKEISILIAPIASITRVDSDGNNLPYNHEEAALIGNLVRYCKYSSAFIEQYVKKRLETSLVFFRCLVETYINLKYFLKFKDEYTLKHYIKNSLRLEKELLAIIKKNIKDRNKVEHIEKRMMDSINNSFRQSDFDEADINNSSKFDMKIKARLKDLIEPELYSIVYGVASHAVHGNWQDLIGFHLVKEGDGFLPDLQWHYPTIQLIDSLTILSCDLLINYSQEVLPQSKNKEELIQWVQDIMVRTFKLDELHEKFMQRTDESL